MSTIEERGTELKSTPVEIYADELDDLVSVNSLFTVAVFVGLSFAKPGQVSLDSRRECDADTSQAKLLVILEVVSFSCFLLSSLVAKSLKINLQLTHREENFEEEVKGQGRWRLQKLRWVMLVLSVLASFFGCVSLIFSMMYVIQIRLGKLSCKSAYTWGAILAMFSIFGLAMVFSIPVVGIALYKTRHPYGGTTATDKTDVVEHEIDKYDRSEARNSYNKAVDDLVNVNKMFTLAVFLGLSFSTATQQSLENRAECVAGLNEAKRIIVFEVVSFSWFLSSTVLAATLSLHINIHRKEDDNSLIWSANLYRLLILFLSLSATFLGYAFLIFSMVDIIQFQLGRLSCRGFESLAAALALLLLGTAALFFFFKLMVPALIKGNISLGIDMNDYLKIMSKAKPKDKPQPTSDGDHLNQNPSAGEPQVLTTIHQ